MTQSTNNQILLNTLAFCAAVAGLGASPAIARCFTTACQMADTPLEKLEARQDWLEEKYRRDRIIRQLQESNQDRDWQ